MRQNLITPNQGARNSNLEMTGMCGRSTNEMTWAEIHALYSIHDAPPPTSNVQPRINFAPTQTVDFAHLDKAGNLELDRGRWWLVPFFAKELPKAAMFNARIETIDTSGAFRESFKSGRCLIPAVGYFEWTVSDEDGKTDPWLLQMPDGEGFSFAGIWAHNDKSGRHELHYHYRASRGGDRAHSHPHASDPVARGV